MAKKKDPTYRLHRQSGQAVVTLRDPATGRRRDVLLGEHDTPASHAEYARVVKEWNDAGRVLDDVPKPDALTPTDRSVARLLLDYIAAEQKRYGVESDDKQPSNIVRAPCKMVGLVPAPPPSRGGGWGEGRGLS